MKKLMLLASAVAMACTVQAANFQWGFQSADIIDINGNYMGEAFLATPIFSLVRSLHLTPRSI